MNNMFDISGKKAIVTGGTRGLGYSMAEALCTAGCDVVIIGSSDRVYDSAKQLSCKAVKADLASKEENYRAFNESLVLLGGELDGARIIKRESLAEISKMWVPEELRGHHNLYAQSLASSVIKAFTGTVTLEL